MSNDRSILLLTALDARSSNNQELAQIIKLKHKEYHSGISRLMKMGLVKRKQGKYSLTALGRIVLDAVEKIGVALDNEWRLRVIDSVDSTNNISVDERNKLLDTLLDEKLSQHHFTEI